nr:hypothetical protein CFP56_32568 [Quercus suber]
MAPILGQMDPNPVVGLPSPSPSICNSNIIGDQWNDSGRRLSLFSVSGVKAKPGNETVTGFSQYMHVVSHQRFWFIDLLSKQLDDFCLFDPSEEQILKNSNVLQ